MPKALNPPQRAVLLSSNVDVQGFDDKLREIHRDNCMIWGNNKAIFAILGIESQTAVDKTMVGRVMFYDWTDYLKQFNETPDHIRPVITYALYFGKGPWTGPRTLGECVEFIEDTEEVLRPDFNDFKLKIIDFHDILREQIEAIEGDFRFYATFLYNMAHQATPHDQIEFPAVEDLDLAKDFVKIFSGKDEDVDFPTERLLQGGYAMSELFASYIGRPLGVRRQFRNVDSRRH